MSELRAFASASPLAGANVVHSAATTQSLTSTPRANPFASLPASSCTDISTSPFAQVQQASSSRSQQTQLPPTRLRHFSTISSNTSDPPKNSLASQSSFYPEMWRSGSISSSTTKNSSSPTTPLAAQPARSMQDASQDDRFPVNFDAPGSSFSCDLRSLVSPQPARAKATPQPTTQQQHWHSQQQQQQQQVSSSDLPPSYSESQALGSVPPMMSTQCTPELFEERCFNYEGFKEQMRAMPCLQELKHHVRSFVSKNLHRVAPVEELVAEVAQFMSQMSLKFAANEAWKHKPACDLDHALEGLEHFVCLNLYNVLFQPQLSDDSDKDKLLYDRVMLLRFIEGKHLDLPPDCCSPAQIDAAARTLATLDKHKTPREKLECINDACKILRDMLKHPSIDREQFFLSTLVLATLRAHPKHLYSNLQFIRRFRNPIKLTDDDKYNLTHLSGAVDYLEKVEPQWLSIEPAEFDASINRSVDSLGNSSPASVRSCAVSSMVAAGNTDTISLVTPTATAHAPWRTGSSASCASSSATVTAMATSTVAAPAEAECLSSSRLSKDTSGKGTKEKEKDPCMLKECVKKGKSAAVSMCASLAASTATLAASLRTGWCDVGAELANATGIKCSEAKGNDTSKNTDRSTAPTSSSSLPTASACSGSSGIASLADLDPLGQCSTTAESDTLSIHSLAWGCPSPADPSPRSRTASMRSALSHHSTDVAQCHAADLAAFAPAATSSPGRPPRPPAPLDPYRDGGIQQLLAAASEPPVDKFMQCDVEALGMSDIPLLLSDYKRLASLNASMSRILRLNTQ